MSPPSRNSKSSAFSGAVTVDMAVYSPILKSSGKSELAVSRIHCIPLLMLFVFFILWAASSEVLPDVRTTTTSTQLGTSELELKMGSKNEINSQPGGRTVLQQHQSSHYTAADSLRDKSQDSLPEKAHLRGNARSDTAR